MGKIEGQMWPKEREFLFNAILERKPKNVFEAGTWKGGGSTLQIGNALKEIGSGHLYTCELNEAFYNQATQIFDDPKWKPYVTCHLMPSTQLLTELFNKGVELDFIFFDGAPEAEVNLSDFQLMQDKVPAGTYFCSHDWDLRNRADGGHSTRSVLLRPYLEKSKKWKILKTLTRPISVGMVLAVKL